MPFTCSKCFSVPCICTQRDMQAKVDALDFRQHTCGECAWALRKDGFGNILFCRRVSWNPTPTHPDLQWSGLGEVFADTPACPAYVPRTLEASDAKAE